MDVREAITLIGSAAMCKESGVAKVTVDVAKKNNRFQETSAGQKMRNVCKAHALDVDGVNGNGEDGQAELPIADPLLVRIKKEELRQKAADADKRERLNEEANGLRWFPRGMWRHGMGWLERTSELHHRFGAQGPGHDVVRWVPGGCSGSIRRRVSGWNRGG